MFSFDPATGRFRSLVDPSPQRRPLVYNYSYEDTIKGQTYITFDGLQVDRERISELIAYDTGATEDNRLSATTDRVAQTFTVGSDDIWVTSIEVSMEANSGLTGAIDATMEIQATTAGEPNGVVLDTATITNLPDETGYIFQVFSFDNVRLLAGVQYAIVISADDFETTGDLDVRADGTSPSFAGGSIFTSADSGSNWTEDTGGDMMFRINGKTTNSYILFPAANITSTDDSTSQVTNDLDINFDFIVNSTVAIKGMVLLDIGGSASFLEVDLIDFDGTTETSLVTGTTDGGTATLAMDITSWKRIRRGNTLRLNVRARRDTSATTSINHSGNNLKLHLPFRVELPD